MGFEVPYGRMTPNYHSTLGRSSQHTTAPWHIITSNTTAPSYPSHMPISHTTPLFLLHHGTLLQGPYGNSPAVHLLAGQPRRIGTTATLRRGARPALDYRPTVAPEHRSAVPMAPRHHIAMVIPWRHRTT